MATHTARRRTGPTQFRFADEEDDRDDDATTTTCKSHVAGVRAATPPRSPSPARSMLSSVASSLVDDVLHDPAMRSSVALAPAAEPATESRNSLVNDPKRTQHHSNNQQLVIPAPLTPLLPYLPHGAGPTLAKQLATLPPRDRAVLSVVHAFFAAQQEQRTHDVQTIHAVSDFVHGIDNRVRSFRRNLAGLESRFAAHLRNYARDRSNMQTHIKSLQDQIIEMHALLRAAEQRDEELRIIFARRNNAAQTGYHRAPGARSLVAHCIARLAALIEDNVLVSFLVRLVFRQIPQAINSLVLRPAILLLLRFLRVEQVIREDAYANGNAQGYLHNDSRDHDDGDNNDDGPSLSYDKQRARMLLGVLNALFCETILERLLLPLLERSSRPVLSIVVGWLFGVRRELSSNTHKRLRDSSDLGLAISLKGTSKAPGLVSIMRASCNAVGDLVVLFVTGIVQYYDSRSENAIADITATSEEIEKNVKTKTKSNRGHVGTLMVLLTRISGLARFLVLRLVVTSVYMLRGVAYFSLHQQPDGTVLKSDVAATGYAGTERLVSFRTVSLLQTVIRSTSMSLISSLWPFSSQQKAEVHQGDTPELGSILQLALKAIAVSKGMKIVHELLVDAVIRSDVIDRLDRGESTSVRQASPIGVRDNVSDVTPRKYSPRRTVTPTTPTTPQPPASTPINLMPSSSSSRSSSSISSSTSKKAEIRRKPAASQQTDYIVSNGQSQSSSPYEPNAQLFGRGSPTSLSRVDATTKERISTTSRKPVIRSTGNTISPKSSPPVSPRNSVQRKPVPLS